MRKYYEPVNYIQAYSNKNYPIYGAKSMESDLIVF